MQISIELSIGMITRTKGKKFVQQAYMLKGKLLFD